jgi:hypothetical protein
MRRHSTDEAIGRLSGKPLDFIGTLRKINYAISTIHNHTHRIRGLNSGGCDRSDDYVELHYYADNQFSSGGIGQF